MVHLRLVRLSAPLKLRPTSPEYKCAFHNYITVQFVLHIDGPNIGTTFLKYKNHNGPMLNEKFMQISYACSRFPYFMLNTVQ